MLIRTTSLYIQYIYIYIYICATTVILYSIWSKRTCAGGNPCDWRARQPLLITHCSWLWWIETLHLLIEVCTRLRAGNLKPMVNIHGASRTLWDLLYGCWNMLAAVPVNIQIQFVSCLEFSGYLFGDYGDAFHIFSRSTSPVQGSKNITSCLFSSWACAWPSPHCPIPKFILFDVSSLGFKIIWDSCSGLIIATIPIQNVRLGLLTLRTVQAA